VKKILLLGGSTQQITAIEYEKKQGYGTILCDYLPDNPGQNYVGKFYCISTTDKEAVLQVAQKEKVDRVVAYASDPVAPTAAYVAEKMGLPTSPYKSVELLTNKDKFRAFLAEYNFCAPKAKGYASIEEAKKDIERFRVLVLIKLLNYSYKEQWKDIMPSLLLSLVMGAVVYSVQLFGMTVWTTLIVQRFVGIILYVGMARIFKLECFIYLISTGKDIFNSRKGKSI